MHIKVVIIIVAICYSIVQRSETHSSAIAYTQNASISKCVGEKLQISIRSNQKCTRPIRKLTTPSGETISHSKGKIILCDDLWEVTELVINDGGLYVSQLSCDEGKWNTQVMLDVNCEKLLFHHGEPKARLHFPTPRKHGGEIDNIKMKIIQAHLKNGAKPKVFENGYITQEATRYVSSHRINTI